MGRKRRESAEVYTRSAQDMRRADPPLIWGAYIIRPTDRKYEDIREAPNAPGIYAWYSRAGDLMYVGRSVAIASRLRQHQRRTAFWATPSLYSYRLVPPELVAGVEVAHIDALSPRENRSKDSASTPFQDALTAAIEAAWQDVLSAQQARLDAAYTKLAEQIAARL
jgi:hypothetical protein